MIFLVSPYFFELRNMVLLLARTIHWCDEIFTHVGLCICHLDTLLILSATHRSSDLSKYPLEE